MTTPLSQLESLDRYTLLRELGRGGMSVVYLAKDTELGREVAIKCVDTSDPSAAKLAERLRSEAKLLAQLNHPNIVQLYDVVEQGNILGLVIEFVGGDTLTQRLKQAPSKEVKLKWLAEVADGLASAHQKGIAHCDLKADNVLITHDNIAKVADFGIAKVKLDDYLEDDGLTRVDSVSGSYFSLSPEQATGQAVDTRTDLFSLAILIHQTLTNQHPFGDTSNKVALLQRVINDPVEINDIECTILGVRLVELVKNLLQKEPKDRLYTASETIELIRGELSNPLTGSVTDSTTEIPTKKPERLVTQKSNGGLDSILSKVGLIVSGFLVGIVIFQVVLKGTETSNSVSYIALDTIEVTASEEFNKSLVPLIKDTLKQSAETTLLNFKETGLVDAKDLSSIEGDYFKKAQVTGVNDIVVVSANCIQQKCDIKLQRRTGERMAVAKQTSFPIASDSLIELRNAVFSQLPKLFNASNLPFISQSTDLDEENYRRYLEISAASKSGNGANELHFRDVQKLLNDSPDFIPTYILAYRIASFLDRNLTQKNNLRALERLYQRAPSIVKESKRFKKTEIHMRLALGQTEEAKLIYSKVKAQFDDVLYISEIESSIAFAENDYEKLLFLDRQNASWRPSAENFYNLATSEFFLGNYVEAKRQAENALKLQQSLPDALELIATIEMSLGNIEAAIKSYKAILEATPESNSYSNYGLALALNKNYNSAIESHLEAVKLKPKSPLFRLNLADAYNLIGEKELAALNYQKIVELLNEPKTAQDFSHLAQAQAHLGLHSQSVRTLKTANKKFPNIAELDYASSIVNTIAGNFVSAVVDVNDAIERGIAPVWFAFEWFKPLCKQQEFITLTESATSSLCR